MIRLSGKHWRAEARGELSVLIFGVFAVLGIAAAAFIP
jgi:hypothetical protein